MRDRKKWPDLDIPDLEKEVAICLKLHGDMVGTLYPSILRDEIADLRVLISAKRKEMADEGLSDYREADGEPSSAS